MPLPRELTPTAERPGPTFVFEPQSTNLGGTQAPRFFDELISETARNRWQQGGEGRTGLEGGGGVRRGVGEGERSEGATRGEVRAGMDAMQPPQPQQQPIQHATPARPMSQSAAGLAASFVPPSTLTNPIPIPAGPPHPFAAGNGAVAHNPAHQGIYPMNPGAMGGLVFTPVPVGGFPEVVRAEPDGLLQGLSPERIEALLNSDCPNGPLVTFQVYNGAAPPPHEVRPIIDAATTVFRQVTGEISPLMVPPERHLPANPEVRVPNPRTWAAIFSNQAAVEAVMSRPAWSSPIGTFLVSRPEIVIGRFILMVGGFSHDRNGSILQAVFMVFSGPVILPIILQLVRTNPRFANVSIEDAARAILGSLEVRVSTLQNGNLIAAVFCDSPTQSIPRWREWRDRLTTLPFPSPLNSTGTARRQGLCAGCHGADHLTHMCPFQDVPGWNAPAPGTNWRHPTLSQLQGGTGQQPPPPPPPAGGATAAAASRARQTGPRRPNLASSYIGPRREFQGGNNGGFGPGGGAAGACAF